MTYVSVPERKATKAKHHAAVIHYPRLDTVLMVEDSIRKAKTYPNKAQLWKSLKTKMMYQTFILILRYLEESNKILFDKDGSIIWIFVDNPKLERLVQGSIRVR